MSLRVCADRDCPALVDKGARDGRCATHQRARDKARGSRQVRGYDAAHTRTRERLLPLAIGRECHHCGQTMTAGQALALDHTADRSGYRGICHASCNASEGASRGNRERY